MMLWKAHEGSLCISDELFLGTNCKFRVLSKNVLAVVEFLGLMTGILSSLLTACQTGLSLESSFIWLHSHTGART